VSLTRKGSQIYTILIFTAAGVAIRGIPCPNWDAVIAQAGRLAVILRQPGAANLLVVVEDPVGFWWPLPSVPDQAPAVNT
jgi:hypothetical protein